MGRDIREGSFKGILLREGYTYSDRYGFYGYSNVAFEVARAAEEIRRCSDRALSAICMLL